MPHACTPLINPHLLGFPDKGYFGYVSKWTHTPLRAIGLTTLLSILPGFLQFASPVAVNAIFSLTAMALDISYIIPIALRRIYQHHPEVQFKPGPFYLGDGLLGWAVNLNCIVWTLFVSVIFSLPTYLPVTRQTMNYASVITGSVVLLAMCAVTSLPSWRFAELCCVFF
jgi:Amino acid permease